MSITRTKTLNIVPDSPLPASSILLTFNDIVMPQVYTRMLFFFENKSNSDDFMNPVKLRDSLERILKSFPILFGQLEVKKDGLISVIPSKRGVPFHLAETDLTFAELQAKDWEHSATPEAAPYNAFPDKSNSEYPVFAVQHTFTKDGNCILATALHHSIADGIGCVNLLKSWAKENSGQEWPAPLHDRKQMLDIADKDLVFSHPEYKYVEPVTFNSAGFKLPEMESRIIRFSETELKLLKEEANSIGDGSFTLSRNNALYAHLWRCIMRARGTPEEAETALGHAVNGRERMDPPLPDTYFGNANFYAYTQLKVKDLLEKPLGEIAKMLRGRISIMNSEYIRSALAWVQSKENKTYIQPAFHSFLGPDVAITSWDRFGMYDVDFGYGVPKKVRLPPGSWDGLALVFNADSENTAGGVECYVGLTKEAMTKLLCDPILHKHQ